MYFEAIINSIIIDNNTNFPVINLETEKHILPVVIGYNEAMAITIAIEKKEVPRPLTHDLITTIIKGFNSELEGVYIYKLEDGTYYAKIRLIRIDSNQPGHKNILEIDCRPSDAIAICLRLNSKIFIEEKILEVAGIKKS
ncbi:MAG TPA: bifunctional nuclease family protein [bacterium]|nr:bifunctional nuclease family protein [bacterium]HOL47850.1 bifunctional nuclease family protein [bacterium]HPQ19852.1 bifunctional nuclease family protein [bacterium]